MKKILLFTAALALMCNYSVHAQSKKAGNTKSKTTKSTKEEAKTTPSGIPAGYKLTPGGLQYKIIVDAPGDRFPKLGDNVEMHIHTHVGDSSLFDSRKLNNGNPVPFQIMPPSFKGDLVEGFMLLTPGDSAVFQVSVDSVKKAGAQLLPWMKEGDMIVYEVVLVSVKSPEEVKKEAEEKAKEQVAKDEKLLQDYFTKNNIKPTKTESGLYYTMSKEGEGVLPKAGEQITVNYTGKTIDGNVFDSNLDPKFNHVQPFSFAVGQGQVIKGWDEGLMLMKKGGKATFYIPSTLAYGERSPAPSIPANSILIFDVEVTDIASKPAPDPNRPMHVTPAKNDKPGKK